MKIATLSRKYLALPLALIALASAVSAQRTRQAQPPMPQQQVQPQVQQPAPQAQPNQPAQPQQMGQMQAAAPNSLCANRPLCYDANDYVVTVTEFRSSTDGRGSKILDAMLHFVNKTNQPISLGYVDQSGAAIDDMGNRYLLNTYAGGVRGMGIVAGNNMDPKFSLPGGGSGDVRLEFWWAPYGKLAGVNYEIEFSVREMNRVEGNQWMLGDEALIHYQGLANGMGVAPVSGGNSFASGSGGFGNNGMAGTTPAANGGVFSSVGSAVNTYVPGQANNSAQVTPVAYVAAGQPCPAGSVAQTSTASNVANAVGQQNQTANNAISNASSAISSFGSLFKKKSAAPKGAAGTTPCVAATNTATPMATPAAVAPTANVATAPAGTNVNAAQPRAVNARVARTPTNTAVKPATTPQTSRAVTNAALKQPAPGTAKPSPTKPANKAQTSTTNPQGH
ncbi:MAG TPA: hypothetical protein VF133_01645 [Terriglobales bacterium]